MALPPFAAGRVHTFEGELEALLARCAGRNLNVEGVPMLLVLEALGRRWPPNPAPQAGGRLAEAPARGFAKLRILQKG